MRYYSPRSLFGRAICSSFQGWSAGEAEDDTQPRHGCQGTLPELTVSEAFSSAQKQSRWHWKSNALRASTKYVKVLSRPHGTNFDTADD